MDRDREGFRERFKGYKDGKPVSEIYDAGLPKYEKGKQGFSAATKKLIDRLYKSLLAKGFDAISAAGIIGNAIQESSLNPDSVNSLGYSGLFLNSKLIRLAVEDQYGDYSYDSQLRYLDDWTSANTWIRKGKYRDYTAAGSGAFKRTGYKSAHDAADAFMKLYERPVIMKDGRVVGYLDWDKRRAYAQQVHDYLTGMQSVVEEKPITQTTAAEYNAANQFQPWENYHQPDYSLNNPAPSSISSWNNPKSPAYTPAGLQARRINFGKTMMDMLLDDEWEPPIIRPLKTVNAPDAKVSTFAGFKNGKLPGFRGGAFPNMGEKSKVTTGDIKYTAPVERGLSGYDPVAGAFVTYMGGKALTAAAAAYNRLRALEQGRRAYKQARLWNDLTRAASRAWKMQDADRYARNSVLSGSDNPIGWLYDVFGRPLVNAYDRLNLNPIIGPLIP